MPKATSSNEHGLVYVYKRARMCEFVCVCVYMNVWLAIYICMCLCACVCVGNWHFKYAANNRMPTKQLLARTYTFTTVYVCISICTFTCIYVCVWIYTQNSRTPPSKCFGSHCKPTANCFISDCVCVVVVAGIHIFIFDGFVLFH